MAQRGGHYCTIPLCRPCHQGPEGIHGDRSRFKRARVTEISILNETIPTVAHMLAAARMM